MKKYSIAIVLMFLCVACTLIFTKKESNTSTSQIHQKLGDRNIHSINDIQKSSNQIANNQVIVSNTKRINYFGAYNIIEGTIGILDSTKFDNPTDNIFHLKINQEIKSNSLAYLEYELFGVKDHNSVCRGINDQLSFGGIFVKISNSWSKQNEKISSAQLRKGDNIIRFSIPSNCDFGYKIRNLRIRIVETNDFERKLVINQPSKYYFNNRYGYINGYATGKGSDKVKFYANGKLLKSNKGSFEGKIEKSQDSIVSWETQIIAVYENGEKLSSSVEFNDPMICDYIGNYKDTFPHTEVIASKSNNINLKQDNFTLQGEKGSVRGNVNLSVTGLRTEDLPMISSSMINVTGYGNNGYRCLPHGSLFDKEIKIHIAYDSTLIPSGYSANDIRTFYFDEKESRWIMLPLDTINIAKNEVVSYTNHFTDFINGILKTPETPETQAFTPTSMKDIKFADPMAGFSLVSTPTANNSGTANLSYPIEVPSGRQGMSPQLAISYSSEGGNGWLGDGWNINTPSISVDTRWGVPHYYTNLESESYLLNGEQLQMLNGDTILPLVQRAIFRTRKTDTIAYFIPRVEGAFNKIIRHGNSPSTYWWEVIDKQGVTYSYGKYSTDNNFNQNCGLADGSDNIAQWMLAEVRDLNGNFIKYNYKIVLHTANTTSIGGKQIFIESINYTGFGIDNGKYKVEFKSKYPRTDVILSSRSGFKEVTDSLLGEIKISYSDQFVKSYKITYKQGAFNKSLICAIWDICDSLSLTNFESLNMDCDSVPIKLSKSYAGIKIHKFEYFDGVNQEFSTPVPIATPNDNGVVNLFKDMVKITDEYSLGRNITNGSSIGGSLNAGIGKDFFKKKNSLGGNYTYSDSKTNVVMMLADINGDGLPDRIYTKNSNVYYQKLMFDNGMLKYDTQEKLLQGLPSLGKSNSYGDTWGVEGQIYVVNASYAHTSTTNITKSYFSDVNADGFPDFIDDGTVYYNFPDINGDPIFTQETNGEIQYVSGGCNYIIRSGEVNDSVYTPRVDIEKDILNKYNRDAVRVWISPDNGNIVIKCPIQLIEDTSYSRKQSKTADGIRYSVQHNGINKKQDTISASDYSVHLTDSIAIFGVSKGDRIYFRLESKNSRVWDKVYWNPTIYFNNGTLDTVSVDADGKKIKLFRASEDMLVNNKQIFQAPFQGKVRIRGTMTSTELSDSINFKILKGINTIKQRVFPDDSLINYSIDDSLNVVEGDSISFNAISNTNIDWNKINYNFKVYYYKSDSVTIDTLSNTFKCEVHPILQFNIYQKSKQITSPDIISVGNTYTFTPSLSFNSTTIDGNVVFAIKKLHKVIAKKTLTIVNGVVTGNPSITINVPSGTYYYEFYCDSNTLADTLLSASILLNSQTRSAGFHYMMPDTMWKFGNLYRGWGQFSYNGQTNVFGTTIAENKLYLSSLFRDTNLIAFDTVGMSSPSAGADILKKGGLNNPKDEYFNIMFPDIDSMVWRDYAQYSYVGKSIMSNARSLNTLSDSIIDNPLLTTTIPGMKIRAVRKSSEEENDALSIGLSTNVYGQSKSWNTSSTFGLMDYFDLNGDQYPDIIGKDNVQYSTPQGGFCPNITSSIIGGKLEESQLDGEGMSHGVNLPTGSSTTYNLGPITNSAGAPIQSWNMKVKNKKSSLSLGQSVYDGNSKTNFIIQDVNGDGLPDKIDKSSGLVALNKGYSFENFTDWGLDYISKSTNNTKAYNAGVGQVFENEMQNILNGSSFNKSEYSWSGGASLSTSFNEANLQLADINGDGLVDIFYLDATTGKFYIYLNTGNGFSGASKWSDNGGISASRSVNGSANIAGSFGFPVFPYVKLVINLQGGLSTSASLEKVMMSDFNNDGYLDIVSVYSGSEINVQYSNLGKVNLLKQVTTPVGSSFQIDYSITESNLKMPHRKWTMSSLKVFDGHKGDGIDSLFTRFSYSNGNYDRFERIFFGFETVTTKQYNTFYTGSTCYRSTLEKFHNTDFLFKGLKYYEATYGGTTTKYTDANYKYDKKEISTGKIVPDSLIHCFGPYYPAISQEDKYFYEGTGTAYIHTQKQFVHGKYGNIIKYYDFGDVADNSDNITGLIEYTYDTTKNLTAMVQNIQVKSHDSTLVRYKSALYTAKGQVSQLNAYNGALVSNINISYDTYGNIIEMMMPSNNNNQRLTYNYYYDNTLHAYPIKVRNNFGYSSLTTYDYRLGVPLEVTDISGNKMQYSYCLDGKLKTIRGPKEIASGAPFTIKFEYWDEINHTATSMDTVIWAKTTHFDPLDTGNKFISVSFVDGLGRAIQSKQKVTISGNDSIVVSGKVFYDAYGRANSMRLPITESIGNELIFNANYSNLDTSYTLYDVLDRPLTQRAPDNSIIQYSYGFGTDAFGKTRFKTVVTDPNSKISTSFVDARGLNTSVLNPMNTVTKFSYNSLGEMLNSTDPENNQTTYTYDKFGRLTQRVHPDAGTTSYNYDKAGNLVSMSTANLAAESKLIYYWYNLNRLDSISYPKNPENNVYYIYGDSAAGNKAGKMVRMQDATGVQEFSYGNMGELTQNIHTFVKPFGNTTTLTFKTSWEYDSWNRLIQIVYPDSEKVSYKYDNSGQLISMIGIKENNNYSYIDSITYSKYGSRSYIKYGNGNRTYYSYNPLNQRLTNLKSIAFGSSTMQNLNYVYDAAGNIKSINNIATVNTNGLGGTYTNQYIYDDLYRLTQAYSTFNSNQGQRSYFTNMEYSPSGNITNKYVISENLINGITQNVENLSDYIYQSKPHAPTKILGNNGGTLTWDANGNMTNFTRTANSKQRNLAWDEENRLTSVADITNGLATTSSSYIYNAGGDRIWKMSGDGQQMKVNGQTIVSSIDYNRKTLYANAFITLNDLQYTKHYYIEGERVCSKIGNGFASTLNPTLNPVTPITSSTYTVLKTKLSALNLRNISNSGINTSLVNFDTNFRIKTASAIFESDQYYYHSDHLGSASFISDAGGNPVQHLQYLPFGETFVDQRSSTFNAQYKFSGKEKDDETGFSYFGARYYDSDVGIWLSVDPMASKYPHLSPYNYCEGNPINLIDPTGLNTIKRNDDFKNIVSEVTNNNNPSRQYELPESPSNINNDLWESYTPNKHTGHDQYWRNKENGSFLVYDKAKASGGKGHYHLYTNSRFKVRIDLEGNFSSKGIPKGNSRFHLQSGSKINLNALAKTMTLFNIAFIGVDIAGIATEAPNSLWACKWGIDPTGDSQNRAYGLINFSDPFTPYIFEFTKISSTSMEIRFYKDFYYDHDFGFWKGIGLYDKEVYFLEKGTWVRNGHGSTL